MTPIKNKIRLKTLVLLKSKTWWSRGIFTLEAALITGILLMVVFVLTLGLFKTVYLGGLEAIFNYADNNVVFQTAGDNMKKGPDSAKMFSNLVIKDKLLVVEGTSHRRVLSLSFSNVIERSNIGRRLVAEQVMVEMFESLQSKKSDGE